MRYTIVITLLAILSLCCCSSSAARRAPGRIRPSEGFPDVYDFTRDIQPVLDQLCVDCHDYEKTKRGGPCAGNVILIGDRGPMFSPACFAMTVRELFVDGRELPES